MQYTQHGQGGMDGLQAISFVILVHNIVGDIALAVEQEVVGVGAGRLGHPNTEGKGTVQVVQKRHKVAIPCRVPVSLSKIRY